MPSRLPAPKREIELDFVRGIAILLVLNYHYAADNRLFHPPFLSRVQTFGWIGVDIFFVLSGFLVGGLMLKEWKTTGKVNSLRFLKRRAFKIWPAYYAFLLTAAIIHVRPLRSFFWQNLLSIQNYVPTTLSHTWSLAVEEHFYLLLAVVVWLFAARSWRPRTLFLGCMGTALAVEALRAVLIVNHRSFYFYTHTRIDALLLGVMLAILRHFYPQRFHALQRQRILFCVLIAAALIALFRDVDAIPITHEMRSPFLITLVDYASAALLLLLYHPGGKHSRLYRIVARIGVFSYGIYLWHVSVERPVNFVVRHMHGLPGAVTSTFLPYFLAIGLGIAATKVVEFPFLRLRERVVPSTIPEPPVPVA